NRFPLHLRRCSPLVTPAPVVRRSFTTGSQAEAGARTRARAPRAGRRFRRAPTTAAPRRPAAARRASGARGAPREPVPVKEGPARAAAAQAPAALPAARRAWVARAEPRARAGVPAQREPRELPTTCALRERPPHRAVAPITPFPSTG